MNPELPAAPTVASSDKDLDVFDVLHENALFVKSNGGSSCSQFHRLDGEEDPQFQKIAANEYDSLMILAAANNIDTTDEKAVEAVLENYRDAP